jgi:hypothetical protein
LQEKEGGLDGTQLSFVNNKGESLHRVPSIASYAHSGYRGEPQNKGKCTSIDTSA